MKEVIFHFFPSARFLGLSLKILFHKNKEIKRMLSKKMTFSLMSLITILAFAFAVPSVMAADEITATLSADTDAYGEEITVTVAFDKAVGLGNLVASKLTVTSVANNGAQVVLDPNVVAAKDTDSVAPGIQTDDKTFTITIPAQIAPNDVDPTVENLNMVIGRLIVSIPSAKALDPTSKETSKAAALIISLKVVAVPTAVQLVDIPKVVSIQRLRPGSQSVVSAFQEEVVTVPSFDVRFVLTEAHSEYDGGKTAKENADRLIEVENATVSNLVVGVPFARARSGDTALDTVVPHPLEGDYDHNLTNVPGADQDGTDTVPDPTGTDDRYRQYRVTVTPHVKKGDKTKTFNVKVKVKNFHDGGATIRNTYVSPGFGDSVNLPPGREILTVEVAFTAVNLKAGYRVAIPKEIFIPGGGYLIVAKSKGGSEVDTTGQDADRTKDAPRATFRTPAQMLYNVHEAAPALPNLATQFLNGVVVDVESGNMLYITEVMWGEDVSLNPSSNSQYIELYNPGAGFNTPDDDASTPDVDERLTLVFYAPNEFGSVAAKTAVAATATAPATIALPGRVTDRVGTLDAKGAYWSPAGKGQTGRSGTGEAESGPGRTGVATVPIVSMYRGMVPDTSTGAAVGAMMPDDGQMAASWISSAGPKSANFDPTALGIRHGTPGATTDATDTPADTAAEKKAAADKAAAAVKKTESTGTIPEDGRIYISEIMFAGGGVLPQWIEIANGSKSEEINLSGWTLTVDNAAADADVSIGASAKFTIADGTTIDMSGQQKSPSTILVVTEAGRNNVDGSGQVLDLMKSNEVDLILAGVVTRKYTLLSDMAFMVTLAPPEPESRQATNR